MRADVLSIRKGTARRAIRASGEYVLCCEHMEQRSDDLRPKLLAELAQCPEVELTGVVDAMGSGGGWSQGDTLWTFMIRFDVWRCDGQAVRERKLTLRRPMPEEELNALREKVQAYDIVRVKARVAEENCFGSPQALLTQLIGKVTTDSELNAAALRLQEPVTFVDDRFGSFTLDRSTQTFTAPTRWNGMDIDLSIPDETEDDKQAALANAASLWVDQSGWTERVISHAVHELLDLKNESWSDDGEEVTADQFRERMKLQSISVDAEGGFEFWFDDGDLFSGHAIMISGNLKEGVRGADIFG